MTRRFSLLVILLVSLACTEAFAQRSRAASLNRQGMEAYAELNIEEAERILLEALQVAQDSGVTGGTLANIYCNLGIVYAGGFADNGTALTYFKDAVRADPNVVPDPLSTTPDIESIFRLAQNQVRAEGGGGSGTGGGTGTGGGSEAGTGTSAGSTGGGTIPHTPVTQQAANTAIPIFVEVPSGAPVSGVTVFYKAPGMLAFSQLEMRRMSGGFGLELSCDEVMVPGVEYYLEGYDEDGRVMGTAGDEDSPFFVEVVSSLSGAAPSLPGMPAPTACVDRECPPGMTCDGGGNAGLGDTCVTTTDCRDGLTCDDNFCIAGDFEEEDSGSADNGDMPRFFASVGFSLGLAWVGEGMRADSMGSGPGYIPGGQDGCGHTQCVGISAAGFVPTYALRLTIGGWIIPRFGIAATLRWQFDAGEGQLSSLLIGVRGMVQLTAPTAEGLHANIFVGTSIGQIQPRPSQQDEDNRPYVVAGLNGVQLGGTVGYRFMRNVGISFTPEVHLLFTEFLFNLDLTASIDVSF